jgi:PKHD-type hydroxylase
MGITYFHEPMKTNLRVRNILTPDQVAQAVAAGSELITNNATTTAGYNSDVRRAKVSHYDHTSHAWLYKVVSDVGLEMNVKHFRFDITGVMDLQYLEYHAEDLGCYIGHMDLLASYPVRKLSMSIQLSEPGEYDGGELEVVLSDKTTIIAPKVAGDAMMFPSFILHRVKPVTRGVRKAIVCWFVGPEYR